MDTSSGKKLEGRYERTELIGVGGMAEVYKGVDVIDNKAVAIKILKKEYAENEEFLRRFRNESKAVAVLSHPNIVKIYDMGFSDKLQYIVMEYIDGITLKEYIEEEKILTWKDTVHFVIQILRALQHAHDKGIVHRDIKPQNIMMFSDGTIKVMDFGIAKFSREEGKTATDQAIGSVHYISPEQASGGVTDAKSDIYSVGAMMYEMLTGRKPFDSDNPVAIAVMHMHDIPERPRAINPDIPDGLEEIVLKAMEKAPEDRYQSTADMIADIEKFKAEPSTTFGYYVEEGEDDNENTRFFNTQSVSRDNMAQGGVQPQQEQPQVQQPVYAGVPAGAAAPYGGQQAYPPQQQPYGGVYNPDDYYEDEEEEEEEEERSSLIIPVLTAVVVVVIIVGVIVISLLFTDMLKDTSQKNDWKMPSVIGMDFNDAVAKYGNNIQFKEDGQVYNEAEPGVIVEQDPSEGVEFKKGAILKVKVSKGMQTVEIPNVTEMNVELAKDMLTQKGLKCEIRNSSSAKVKKGYVIKTEPAAGEEAHKDATIILYVSMGEEAGQVQVDDWVGKSIDDAKMLAEYAGLKVTTKGVASYEKENTVVKQSIKKGEKVETGTEIVFEFSDGTNPDGVIPFSVEFPSDADGRFVISFMIVNDDGSRDSQDTRTIYVPEELSITQDVKGSGEDATVNVLLTNLNNNKRASIGTYKFNFADGTITSKSGGDIDAALTQVDGYHQEVTTQPEEPDTVTVPGLIGSDYDTAVANYSDYFNIVSNGSQPSADYPTPNTIIWQSAYGTELEKGSTIYVTLSSGPAQGGEQGNEQGGGQGNEQGGENQW
ncbi:MAG: Stk1 family PASTA domain-containing Ser/Thr kinase [Ruminococcus sp.]|nr:Stk1 family PASTA domain-containing Ser/Thr kinase [Ruminococcus sp.]